MRILVIALALTACQHANPAVGGPTPNEVLAMIRANPDVAGPSDELRAVRNVRCVPIEEEPTEFSCRVETQDATGVWTKKSAILALDRDGWLLLSLN